MKNMKAQVGADENNLVELITHVQSKREETVKLKRRKVIAIILSVLFIILVILLAYFLVPR